MFAQISLLKRSFINLFISLLIGFAFSYINRILDSENFKKDKKTIILYTFVVGICIFFTILINNIIKVLIISIIIIMANKYIYKNTFGQAVSTAVISYLIFIIGDITSGIIFSDLLKYKITILRNNSILWILSNSVAVIISMLLASLKIIKNTFFTDKNNKKQNALILAHAVITLIFLNLNLFFYFSLSKNLLKKFTIINMLVLIIYLLITIIVFYMNKNLIIEKMKYEQKNNEYEQLKFYTQLIEQLLDDFRKFKHDFSNVMISLGGYLDNNDIDGFRNYYNEIIKEYDKLNKLKDTHNLKYIKNPALKSLLAAKFYHAIQLGVNFKINIFQNIKHINIKTIDLCKIVGILVDNAIEEALKTEEKIVLIGLIEDESEITLVVSNTYKDKPKINKIFEKGYSTKGENRGIGLKILREIIDSYDNILLNTLVDDNFFIQEIIINKTPEFN